MSNNNETPKDLDFCRDGWPLLVKNIEAIFKSLKRKDGSVPHRVRLGCPVDITAPMPADLSQAEPFMFEWASFRGACFRSGELDKVGRDAPAAIVRQIAGSLLLRLMLESGEDDLLIHKVDPQCMGKDVAMIPAQPKAPILVSKSELDRLLEQLRSQIANSQSAGQGWRCDTNSSSYAADSVPLQVVLIADWESLYEEREDGYMLSSTQKAVLSMLSTDVAARNGIYFFICTDWLDSFYFADVLPVVTVSQYTKAGGGYCSALSSRIAPEREKSAFDTSKTYYLRHELLPQDQLEIIQKGYRDYNSGSLTDTEGDGIWLGNSAEGLRAIMGITTQGENQFFELGRGQAFDAFHALIGGATGSGKSVLLREIICSLAERYSPAELRMLLLDYKEGTEFAPFAKLPHVYALSIGSNTEFGLEVLKSTLKEIERRGQLFKNAGNAKNLEEYRRNTGETLCRYVLVADEFQVLLNDKRHGAEAKSVLNDLVRRGRAFGFNAILATQTLRDGALEGEAKNQFACRIAMKMAESETDYFLGPNNTIPSTFNRKGQALLNYALGRKEANILFQSGNKNMPKKYRDTEDVLRCINQLHDKAVAEKQLPSDVYIYSSDGYAEKPAGGPDPSAGVLIGARNNMTQSPLYLSLRQLERKLLVVGGSEQKRERLLTNIAEQLSTLYGETIRVQSPADYLDYGSPHQATVLHVGDDDFDLDEAIAEWSAAGKAAQETAAQPQDQKSTDIFPYAEAPPGMEEEFAALMQSMQNNQASLAALALPEMPARNRHVNRDARCLIIALNSAADAKQMEAAGLFIRDFRSTIYLDTVSYNQLSSEYSSESWGDYAAMLESPRGVFSKFRLM